MPKESVAALVARLRPGYRLARAGRVVDDTGQFMDIIQGDVLRLAGRHYLVFKDAVERRFGYTDPKFWVKKCLELETGARAIVKLVFQESFPLRVGTVSTTCFRSPAKEARVLDVVRGDARFMQGFATRDTAGNLVRVIETVSGVSIENTVAALDMPHADYFRDLFPNLLARFTGACRAIAWLHSQGELHGDVGRDHLWIEHKTAAMRWIDFDYAYEAYENPFGMDLSGLGDILVFLAGQGVHTIAGMRESGLPESLLDTLAPDDFSLVHGNRLANLAKISPYIPERLNRILLHFAAASDVLYESVDELLADLTPVVQEMGGGLI
ncbi:MAG: serine/threonine protein kinase [Desulfovibrionaceae bacterium]|nr:serine/threonine protein kinase [Desulfovibrionaceae bacterium]